MIFVAIAQQPYYMNKSNKNNGFIWTNLNGQVSHQICSFSVESRSSCGKEAPSTQSLKSAERCYLCCVFWSPIAASGEDLHTIPKGRRTYKWYKAEEVTGRREDGNGGNCCQDCGKTNERKIEAVEIFLDEMYCVCVCVCVCDVGSDGVLSISQFSILPYRSYQYKILAQLS